MGKIEDVMRSEIGRLARKEIRASRGPVAKDVRALKRTVSALKKSVDAMERIVAQLHSESVAKKAELEVPEKEVKASRMSAGLIKKLRTRLGLTQREVALLVGVSLPAVTFWESGRSRPQGKNRAALVALRKLGKREVRRILAEKEASAPPKAPKAKARGKRGRRKATQQAGK